ARIKSPRTGNRSVKIIGVSGAESWDRAATLRPGCRKKAVRMYDAANVAKSAIKDEVRVSIRAGLQIAFDDFSSIEGNDDHVAWLHRGVGNAGRLYHHFVAGAVDATDVAPSLDDEAFRDELQVRSANLFFESFQHLSVPISKPLMNTNKHESESNQ